MSNLKLEFKFKLVSSNLKFSSSNSSSDYDLGWGRLFVNGGRTA